jgi:hypothetical protein
MNPADGSENKNTPAALPTLPDSKANKSHRLEFQVPEGVSHDRAVADMAAAGIAGNAALAVWYSNPSYGGELSLSDMVRSLAASGKAVNGGNLQAAEQTLTAQAISLNAIYTELARRAAMNMGEYPDSFERYMRLALKAQGQCRTTLETLAEIKNPPVFAKQANIAHGNQQVNTAEQQVVNPPPHAGGKADSSNELFKELADATGLDAGAQEQTAGANPWLATVDAIHRAKVGRGQGPSRPEQPKARRAYSQGH